MRKKKDWFDVFDSLHKDALVTVLKQVIRRERSDIKGVRVIKAGDAFQVRVDGCDIFVWKPEQWNWMTNYIAIERAVRHTPALQSCVKEVFDEQIKQEKEKEV